MNDIKDILNKMKFVPEELQDAVLEKIKECVEEEIDKSCKPIDLVVQRLKELHFGDKKSKDSAEDRKIIRMIISCMPCDWFYMKPIYCESTEKTSPTTELKYRSNEKLDKFLAQEFREYDDEEHIVYVFKDLMDQCYYGKIDIQRDSVWLWKDGANGELWIATTKGLAKEMLYWFESCFYHGCDQDVECSYKLLNKLERSFPKEDD